jgi:hypothetical protein
VKEGNSHDLGQITGERHEQTGEERDRQSPKCRSPELPNGNQCRSFAFGVIEWDPEQGAIVHKAKAA